MKKINTPKPKVKPVKEKTQKTSVIDTIKSKYQELGKTRDMNKSVTKTAEEHKKYDYVIEAEREDSSTANKFIQSRPRINSKSYVPCYDNDVNDI